MQKVFSSDELGRMRRISDELSKLDAAQASKSLPSVIDNQANRFIDMAVRVFAAQKGGALGAGGGMGGSLQTANIFSRRAGEMLKNVTNVRAREMLMDAIEDPELFKALLTEPGRVELPASVRSKIAPYLVGASSNFEFDMNSRSYMQGVQ